MKKRVTFLLLFAYLLGATPIGEVLKVPMLLGHYLEHSPDRSLSFQAFLKLHYDGNQPTHEHDSHGDLPFKNTVSPLMTDVFHPPAISFWSNRLAICHPRSDNFLTSVYLYSSNFHSAIWQPPRNC
ncbi:MAG TPA: hypothetical protein PLA69_08555 [Flavobacterium sp.]|nr:hypothetical protein [Flavobacterium sp.]